ncbi:Zinc finger RING/FYVE/PHD-type protein [Dioscorea alata]|uniref:Zinc finger RING/FYVE/PHD-type protein n=2 Tax=Dioscorea alata TaxID=55571 RepID=A0ACB7UY38_DIOAL|nr:Zinc finger RING/FYVE/PHD-type protein [Dioscorea alata]KAH7665817.1 Zinc finger RING/FYVE/PHD-type protein [Dioscorea alata]
MPINSKGDIADNVNKLHGEMQRAVFEASQSQLRVVEKLEEGLREQIRDQGFANIMLEEIARAVSVPVEPSEISEELARLRNEKEEAAERKERVEAHFLEQVIELLSRADAANNLEQIRSQYYRRMETAEKFVSGEYIPPLEAFLCPIEGTVMVDPVSLCTGTTCERTAIEGWLQSGKISDPVTNQPLDEFTIRSNILLRQSIEEWRELNYCLKIRSAKLGFTDGSDLACERSFVILQEIIKENKVNKDWIAIDGLIEVILSFIGTSHNKNLKSKALVTLLAITEQHERNKDRVVEAGGIDHIVLCLSRGQIMSKPAISLLFEILHVSTKWNDSVCGKLKQHNSVVLFLVMLMKSTDRESAEKSEAILLKLCDDDDEIVSRAAAANWYMPLIDRLCRGPESSRICMARVITKLELIDQNIQLLGEEGVIPPLVEMASENLESKELALSALAKLSSGLENRTRIITAAGLRPILDQMFSSNSPTIITVKCSEILERLSSVESIELFLDNNGLRLKLGPIVTNLVEMLQKSFLSARIKKPALHILLNLCKFGELQAEEMPAASMVLHLLEAPDREIREVALKLIYLLARYKPEGISEFLLAKRMLETFAAFLEDENRGDLQIAAIGILAFIPKSEVALTECMTNLEMLPLLLNILRNGAMEAKENTLSVLSRFVDPSDIKMQLIVARMGLFSLLVTLLMSGSITAKARAATLLGNLSLNSSKLTVLPAKTGCWCFRRPSVPVCQLHGGICDATSTLCLIQANALPSLVKLLREVHDHVATYETLKTLGTLVQEDAPYRGVKVLHDAGAIAPMLDVFKWGSPDLIELVLGILEKLFKVREVADSYYLDAKIPLIGLSTRSNENGILGLKAASVLAELEQYSKSRSMPLLGA